MDLIWEMTIRIIFISFIKSARFFGKKKKKKDEHKQRIKLKKILASRMKIHLFIVPGKNNT